MKKPFKHTVKINMFDSNVHFYVTEHITQTRNALEKEYPLLGPISISNLYQSPMFTYHQTYLKDYWIFLPPNSTINEIAHECFHCTIVLLSNHGIPLTRENNETGAYLNGFLNGQAHEVLKKYYEKQRK